MDRETRDFLEQLRESVNKLTESINGNGHPGIKGRLAKCEQGVATNQIKLRAIVWGLGTIYTAIVVGLIGVALSYIT